MLLDFINLLLNNFFIIGPAKCMNDEDVEQGVHEFKYFFIDKPMSVGHWNMHLALKIVIELNIYGSIIDQGLRMRLEAAIEHIIC
jgi:hypothetical protein